MAGLFTRIFRLGQAEAHSIVDNIEAPIIVNIGLCGGVIDFGKPLLLPSVKAVTKAAVPAVACTTMPPAKSIVPQYDKIPPPQTQCVTGAYTIKTQRLKKISIAENLILSTKAPIIRAGVMIAKVIWNVANRLLGMLRDGVSNSIEFINMLPNPPIHAFPPENAKL